VSLTEGDILQKTSVGLYCPAGDFHVDPWRPVPRALITHAHSDHARSGTECYDCTDSGASLLRQRVGKDALINPHPYGSEFRLGAATVSLHPAGHILGSAQVRITVGDQTWVITGDHNATHSHLAAEPFEPVPCDVLITETTFGLPVYQWPSPEQVMEDIHLWWRGNQAAGRTSVLPCYPLGKTQRILAALNPQIGPIAVAGSGKAFLPLYEAEGVRFPDVLDLTDESVGELKGKGLVLISFAGQEPRQLKRLQPLSFGAASGWMQIRGVRRSRDFDRGFVLSDHSDWPGLLRCVKASGARRVGVTHGQVDVFARYLNEVEGLESFVVPTHFESGGE